MSVALWIGKAGLATAAFALGLAASWDDGREAVRGVSLALPAFGISAADARPHARAAARVDRRTTRRNVGATHAYFDTLPAGCTVRGQYWYCGGAYYEQVNHNGREVYMVTTP